jgi:hypothetical protein
VTTQPLAVWGKNNPFFLPPGVEGQHLAVHFYASCHFALETHDSEIAWANRGSGGQSGNRRGMICGRENASAARLMN